MQSGITGFAASHVRLTNAEYRELMTYGKNLFWPNSLENVPWQGCSAGLEGSQGRGCYVQDEANSLSQTSDIWILFFHLVFVGYNTCIKGLCVACVVRTKYNLHAELLNILYVRGLLHCKCGVPYYRAVL